MTFWCHHYPVTKYYFHGLVTIDYTLVNHYRNCLLLLLFPVGIVLFSFLFRLAGAFSTVTLTIPVISTVAQAIMMLIMMLMMMVMVMMTLKMM